MDPPLDEIVFFERAIELEALDREVSGILREPLHVAARRVEGIEIEVKHVVAPPCQLAAELNLKRMSGDIMYDNPHAFILTE
jgi:hypothetical protein